MLRKRKRLLSLCLGLVLSLGVGVGLGSAHNEANEVRAANTETITYSLNKNTASKDTNVTVTVNSVTLTFSSISVVDDDYIQLPKSATITSSLINGNIESLTFKDCKHTGTKADGGFTVSCSSDNLTWTTVYSNTSMSSDAGNITVSDLKTSYSYFKLTVGEKRVLKLSGIDILYSLKEPTVTGVSISPSEKTTLVVGKAKEYTVKIEGDNLTKEETVTALYEEYELEGAGVSIDKSTGIKDGDIITATALKSGAEGLLEVKYDDTIKASVEISTEAAKTPISLSYEGTLTTTNYIEGQTFDPTGLTFKAFYEGDTTGSEIDVSHITFSPETLSLGTTKVTASYTENEATVSCDIEGIIVEADYIIDIEFDTSKAKTEYNIGEEWVNDETGVYGIGSYKVSTEEMLEICAKDFTYSGYDSTKGGKQTITVSYPNPKSETPFSTTYTINVISETLKKLESEGDGLYHLVTDYSTLSAGDKIVIAQNANMATAGEFDSGKKFLSSKETTFSTDKTTISSLGAGTIVFTLTGNSNAWGLTNSAGNKLGAYGAGNLTWDDTTTNFNGDWTITSLSETSDGVTYTGAAITSGGSGFGRFLYNTSAPRFTTYTSKVSKSMLPPQIYKLSTDVYSTHEASLALVNTVKSIYDDELLSCDTQGINSTIKWDDIANLFKTNVTGTDELAFLKEAVSDETSSKGTVKKFLADYDYILGKYNATPYSKGYADFLGRNTASTASSISKTAYIGDNNTPILIVILVATVSVTAIGGYFFIRKRKYN